MGSKHKFKCKLYRAWSADLIQRIESAASRICEVQTLSQHLCRPIESRIGEIRTWLAEVRMIQNIEHFCPKLQFEELVNGNCSMHCKIPLPSAKTSQRISPEISLSKRSSRHRVTRRRAEGSQTL